MWAATSDPCASPVHGPDDPQARVASVGFDQRVEPSLRAERRGDGTGAQRSAHDRHVRVAGVEQILAVAGDVGTTERAETDVDHSHGHIATVVTGRVHAGESTHGVGAQASNGHVTLNLESATRYTARGWP